MIILLSEDRQTERQVSYNIPYHMESLKMIQMNSLQNRKQTHRFREQTWLSMGKAEGQG